jgi:hypothetical protein
MDSTALLTNVHAAARDATAAADAHRCTYTNNAVAHSTLLWDLHWERLYLVPHPQPAKLRSQRRPTQTATPHHPADPVQCSSGCCWLPVAPSLGCCISTTIQLWLHAANDCQEAATTMDITRHHMHEIKGP